MRSSVINNERGSVISGERDNTNDYDYSNSDDENGDEEDRSGDSARHILTHSPTPFHFPSLTITVNI